jgi:hypothetical protein
MQKLADNGMSLTAEPETIAASRQARLRAGTERRAEPRPWLDAAFVPLDAWDGIAAQFDDVVQEQLYAYARTCWPSAQPEALVFSRDGEVVGGTLVMLQRLPLRLGTIAISKWGPMLKHARGPNAAALYAGMIDALVEEYAVRRRMLLSVLPRAATGAGNWQYEQLLARRFRAGAVQHFPDRYLVDLRLADAEQRKSLLQKWRYHLNKAEKAGLGFERAGVERAGEFDALYAAMTDQNCSSSGMRARLSPGRSYSRRAIPPSISSARPTTGPCRCAPAISCTGTSSAGCGTTPRRSGTTSGAPMVSRGCTSSRRGWSAMPD